MFRPPRRPAAVGNLMSGLTYLRYKRGERVADLAAELGVKPHHIYAAWHRMGWRADYRGISAAVDRLMATTTDRKEPRA
jgi:uncharacterized protein YjcR